MKWREWILGLLATLIATYTLFYTILPGDVAPLEPSSFAIIRGMGHFQSDHIVIPIEWKNSGGQQELVRPTKLTLVNNTTTLRFELAGEFLGNSSNEPGRISGYSTLKQAFVLSPHSITPVTMVFHINDWWTDKNTTKGRAFTFQNNTSRNITSYNVSIDYSYAYFIDIPFTGLKEHIIKKSAVPLFKLLIRPWFRSLDYETYRWDASSTELELLNNGSDYGNDSDIFPISTA